MVREIEPVAGYYEAKFGSGRFGKSWFGTIWMRKTSKNGTPMTRDSHSVEPYLLIER